MPSQRDKGIAWCDHTWNPTRGCSRVSQGCVNCYAEKQALRFAALPPLGVPETSGNRAGPFAGFVAKVNNHAAWTGNPLIFEVPTTRPRCVEMIRLEGWTEHIPHSACFMCPNLSDAEWIEMKRNWPADFTKACDLESEMRQKDPHFWLHPACMPLAEVDFEQQTTMFSDRGCTSGCFT